MTTQWGLLGPAALLGERRTRSLGILRTVRRFNERAVPGKAGTWFGKQLVLAVLSIRVAKLARAHGLSVRNIECANALEALGCWLGFRRQWLDRPSAPAGYQQAAKGTRAGLHEPTPARLLREAANARQWRRPWFRSRKFGAKSERMNAEQREIFEETLAADQADLEAQLAALQANSTVSRSAPDKQQRRQPKREALPPHLPRVDQRIESEDTRCPTPECGRPMVRVGEDISERLDMGPAKFFAQRQIRGKWACKCCKLLVQEPAAAQIFDNALPTPGLQAHTVVSRFVDHIPYYRQEQINARSGVHAPRSRWRPGAGTLGRF